MKLILGTEIPVIDREWPLTRLRLRLFGQLGWRQRLRLDDGWGIWTHAVPAIIFDDRDVGSGSGIGITLLSFRGLAWFVVAEMGDVAFDASSTWSFEVACHVRTAAVDAGMVDFSALLSRGT